MTQPSGNVLKIRSVEEMDQEELAQVTATLRQDLSELEISDVDIPRMRTPSDSKAADAFTVGALLVTFISTPKAIEAVAGAIQAWLSRLEKRRIYLEIDGDKLELEGLSFGDQRALAMAWVERHFDK